jgi:DNA repair protein RecO (recombination protein O)
MPLVHDRCICLRKVEYSETSQILTLFGREHGLVRVIAKGAHRTTKAGASKFDGGVDLLDLGDAVFSHAPQRDLPPLTEWKLVDGRRELRRNLRAIYLGLYCAELVTSMLEEHDPHPDLFDRLQHTLSELGTPRLEQTALAFQLDLLRAGGYLPELQQCANCGRSVSGDPIAYYAPDQGGVVCRNCEASFPQRVELDTRLLRLMHSLLALPRQNGSIARLPNLTRHQTDPLNRILIQHVEQANQRPLRMGRWVTRA